MTTPTPDPAPDRDLASPVDRALASAMREAGWSWGAVPDEVAEQHLSAITMLATEHAHVAARPPSPTWRSRMRRVAGLTIVKVAVGAGVAAAATTGGLAAGGHLPDPVQGAVADGVGWIGIDLPRPTPSPAADAEDAVEEAPGSTPLEDLPADDAPADDGPAVVEEVPDDAPPVTTPSPSERPEDMPPADADGDADTGERPDEVPPQDAPPADTVPERGSPEQDAPEEDDAPPSRDTQGASDDDAAPRDAPPSAPVPGGPDDGQAQSGQVPTSSSR